MAPKDNQILTIEAYLYEARRFASVIKLKLCDGNTVWII